MVLYVIRDLMFQRIIIIRRWAAGRRLAMTKVVC